MDENVPLSIKGIINNLGHEALTLKDEAEFGIKNGEVAELSIKRNAIIITLDSDFLSLKKDLQKTSKIIYIKIHPRDPKIIATIVQKYLDNAVLKLKNPGKVILSEDDIMFESP
ncbi:MAG: hypothetical protein EU533_02230 [Promethearchaeota archaeon]|nr:MAG: hypothetical protein EU533_02230 [Candidatus Lokiarchaeota archaeon]